MIDIEILEYIYLFRGFIVFAWYSIVTFVLVIKNVNETYGALSKLGIVVTWILFGLFITILMIDIEKYEIE